ncbi:hypothetical protein BGZ99_000227 [Dissophora globulifera]|uniref:L domain-like protein n=1 Tax=Dissophora globulifera TaxID=979702 RepID=A0A9P6R428_9FUNG|nr:hypothetical protein BGZ99_000227 [Dissophora globulifera]
MEIGFLRNLTLLDLSKNRLTALPESIMHLTKLVDLKLSMNQLESIPSGIGGLTKLASLALDSNRLESVPSQIGLIKGLVNLDLSHNPITVLPAEIGKLQFLRRLTLAHCPLVEEFSHSPLHSPPTLLELAARVIVRHSVPTPRMILPHLKTYLKSARTCTFCDGPYFDTFVKRGKMIEKNDLIIPLEYTLCEPHWNTELERIKLLFCPRPLTSPPPPIKANATTTLQGTQSSTMRNGQVARKQSSRANSNSANSSSLALNSNTGMGSGAALNNNGSRPANRKYASERPMSTMGSKLSTFLGPKNGDSSTNTSGSGSSNNNTSKRERPATGLRTSSVPLVTATLASSATEAATAASSSLISSPLSSAFSSAPMTPSSETGEEAAIMPRPRVRRAGTSGLLARAASKLRRPLSMASALALEGEEEVGQSDGTRAD